MVLLHSVGPEQYTVGAGYRLALAVPEAGRPGAPKARLRLVLFQGKRHPAGAGAVGVTRPLLPGTVDRPPCAARPTGCSRRDGSGGACDHMRQDTPRDLAAYPGVVASA